MFAVRVIVFQDYLDVHITEEVGSLVLVVLQGDLVYRDRAVHRVVGVGWLLLMHQKLD